MPTDTLSLRPLTTPDVELLLESRSSREGAGEHQWFGFPPGQVLRAKVAAGEVGTPDGGRLAVVEGDRLAGTVEWFRSSWGRPETSSCWTIAAGLMPEFRGRGIGRWAQRALAEYLFAHSPVERVQAWTDFGNIAEQRALESAGFTREGVIRRAQWRQSAWHDQVLYSILRSDS